MASALRQSLAHVRRKGALGGATFATLGRMRLGVRLRVVFGLGLALTLGACSGDYPLTATRCDAWCSATKGGDCEESYDPAGCVAACERAEILADDTCDTEFEAAVACYRATPLISPNAGCHYFPPMACQFENTLWGACRGGIIEPSGG
jgi:hypothetical protein